MGRRRTRRGRAGRRDVEDLIPFVGKHDSQSYTNMPEDQDQDQPDESFTDVAGPSTGSNEKLRLMVLGGDDALLDKACATILRKRNKKPPFKFGKLEPRNTNACGRQVSVLKTPFTWLEHLKSYLFFSNGVKAIRKDIESYESMLFPGPHAFLLVHRDVKNSGRDNYLLHALSDVFGKKVLDYCMVLFIDGARHNDPNKNYCLKMCGGRNHTLHNTEYSVNELFKKIETMTESKDNSFFTTHLECFRKASNYFQEEYEEKENELRKELNDSKDREDQLSKELNDSEDILIQMTECFTSIHCERQLNEELIIYKDREGQLKDHKEKLQRKVEQLNEKEKQLQNNLTEAKVKEALLLTKLQSECNIIQREEEAQAKEKELNERETELNRRVDERQKELEIREREVTQRDVRSREHHQTTADAPPAEREGELKSRDDSQTSGSLGIQKPVRRNSKELKPPDMSESEHRPLHNL